MPLRLLSMRVTISALVALAKWASVSFTGRPAARATIASASLRSIARPPPKGSITTWAPSAEGARAGARGQIVEAGEPGLGLEVGILDASDRQRGPAQVDLRVGPPQEVAELSEGISSPGRDGSPPS